MGIISKEAVDLLNKLCKYKSYTVHHKYARPSRIQFRLKRDAKKYCIQHNLDHSSSWVLTTSHHYIKPKIK